MERNGAAGSDRLLKRPSLVAPEAAVVAADQGLRGGRCRAQAAVGAPGTGGIGHLVVAVGERVAGNGGPPYPATGHLVVDDTGQDAGAARAVDQVDLHLERGGHGCIERLHRQDKVRIDHIRRKGGTIGDSSIGHSDDESAMGGDDREGRLAEVHLQRSGRIGWGKSAVAVPDCPGLAAIGLISDPGVDLDVPVLQGDRGIPGVVEFQGVVVGARLVSRIVVGIGWIGRAARQGHVLRVADIRPNLCNVWMPVQAVPGGLGPGNALRDAIVEPR